jgi:glycosyltransferase involved in cell wall biosynthesis
MNNLHVSLTEFRNESRVLKEAHSIMSLGRFDNVFVAALYADGLPEHECYGEGVEAKRFKLKTRSLRKDLFTQVFKYLEFSFRVGSYYRSKDIDMINIHALSLLPLGYILKILYGAKLIYDTHELETETNGSKGIRKKLSKWIEHLLIKKVDCVFVVSDNIADWYAMAYNLPRPIVVLNAPKLYTPPRSDQFRYLFGIRDDQIIVLYQGGLSYGRGVELLLKAFQQRNNDRVVLVFMGSGELERNIQEASEQLDIVFYYPAVPSKYVLNYTVSADIGIHMIQNTCLNHYYCMPNKLFEYAMAGIPVIVSDMKEMREMVENYQMGLVVKGEGGVGINKAIDDLIELDLNKLKKNALKAAKDNSWEVQEVKMLNAYKSMS